MSEKSYLHIPDAGKKVPPPPDGYDSWLDAAISTTEFASIRFYARVMTGAEMRHAARVELAALRETAAKWDRVRGTDQLIIENEMRYEREKNGNG